MVADHGKAGATLKQIATARGIMLPDRPSVPQHREIQRISILTGPEFDREYVALMVKDHKKDLKEFQTAAKKSENPELRSFAAAITPVIEQHLQMAEKLANEVKAIGKKP